MILIFWRSVIVEIKCHQQAWQRSTPKFVQAAVGTIPELCDSAMARRDVWRFKRQKNVAALFLVSVSCKNQIFYYTRYTCTISRTVTNAHMNSNTWTVGSWKSQDQQTSLETWILSQNLSLLSCFHLDVHLQDVPTVNPGVVSGCQSVGTSTGQLLYQAGG